MARSSRPILLVENDPRDAELTLTALDLNNLGKGVDVVRDGEEALEYLFREGRHADREPGNPCAVLLDLKMPKVDGLEVLARIREHRDLRNLPVVILTSSREERDIRRSYELGVNAYVVKPLDFSELLDAIAHTGRFWAVLNEPPPE